MKYKYQLNEKLPLLPLLMYGLQWFLVSIPMVLILGAVIAGIQGLDLAEQTVYTQKLMAIMGVGLVLQVVAGHKLPVIIGPASVLLIGIIASGSSNTSEVYTAIVVGGLFLFILFVSKLLPKIQFIFTTRIIVVIMSLIAFTLSPEILKLVFSEGEPIFALSFAIGLVIFMVVANKLLKGIWNSTVVLLAIVLGSGVYFIFQGLPQTSLPTTSESTLSFFIFPFEFNSGVILSFLFCYIALIINELGSIQSVGQALDAPDMNKRSERSVGIAGLLNMLSGSIGVVGPVDYSMSLGLINATGCASRYPLIPAGIGLVICAFLPNVVGIFSYIPHVVMGCIMIYLMASQLAASFQMVATNDIIKNFNHGMIIGLPLMIALIISFMPEELREEIPALIRPIAGNGFVMGVIIVLILEHGIFKERKAKKL